MILVIIIIIKITLRIDRDNDSSSDSGQNGIKIVVTIMSIITVVISYVSRPIHTFFHQTFLHVLDYIQF